ncbi:MAG: ammonia-forming cytochrome c nitrite reductase subunit c552 [Deltaproteobacteria bacterium]|nr:ammonia-forming cytochrome c nitrite reductase subunit c552 [Deltaproteobacteria bacterium]
MRFKRGQQVVLVLGAVLGLPLLLFLIARFLPPPTKDSQARLSLSLNQDIDSFFKNYWHRPIPPQGSPPNSYTEKEASLSPEACGSCHSQQYADWKESLHSKAMGPGPWGQIIDLTHSSPEEAILCMTCHAPLSEQMPFMAKATDNQEKSPAKNPDFDSQLQLQGITCAACHVRQHQRFGPPKAKGASAPAYPPGTPNHGGVLLTPYFEKAEFCRDCHQFDPENSLLVNGKPLQDTYREWKNSVWGKGDAACQECHMPNRRHLWKGIHDAEWVRSGVRMETQIAKGGSTPGSSVELKVEVINAAVGHKFPTYITPKVFVRAVLLDQSSKTLPGTQQERIIGWDARFEGGEWREYFDTRIPPGERSQEIFRWNLPSAAKKVRAWVEVYPDHFYHVHFYPPYLKGDDLTPEGRRLVERALQDSGRSSYILFDNVIPLS